MNIPPAVAPHTIARLVVDHCQEERGIFSGLSADENLMPPPCSALGRHAAGSDAFGHSLAKDAMAVVKANGGEVVGSVRHPFPGSDFSCFLHKAQSSGAQIIGLADAG